MLKRVLAFPGQENAVFLRLLRQRHLPESAFYIEGGIEFVGLKAREHGVAARHRESIVDGAFVEFSEVHYHAAFVDAV